MERIEPVIYKSFCLVIVVKEVVVFCSFVLFARGIFLRIHKSRVAAKCLNAKFSERKRFITYFINYDRS